MTRRTSIAKALTEKIKTINGTAPFTINLYNNCSTKLKFWDEIAEFPAAFVTTGTETRQYEPSNFIWGHLNLCIKLYCKGDEAQDQLEDFIADVEHIIDNNRVLVYDTVNNYRTTEISITSITTDEGLLAPYAVGEVNIIVMYEMMRNT